MIKFYQVKKEDSNIKGYWKDKTGKIFSDNIEIIEVYNAIDLDKLVINNFNNGELAIFYCDEKLAVIESSDDNTTLLENKAVLTMDLVTFEKKKSELLNKYNGFTVFLNNNIVNIEIWS